MEALTYGTNDGRIVVHELETRTSRPVFDDGECQAGFSEWSPDGRHLAFTARRRWPDRDSDLCSPDVYHCTVATGEVTRLTDSPDASDRVPNWSPDGTRIAFHRQYLGEPGAPKRVHLLRAGGGGGHGCAVALLNPSAGRQRFGRLPWSQDGRWFALHAETDEGIAPRVVSERGEDSGWSVSTDGTALTPARRSPSMWMT